MKQIHQIIGNFVREYREEMEQDLQQRRATVTMRKHDVAGAIVAGRHYEHRAGDYVEFIDSNPAAGGRYIDAVMILGSLWEDIRNRKPLDKTSFLELQRDVAEIEFLLSDDLLYQKARGAA